jgi:hypothetical protein
MLEREPAFPHPEGRAVMAIPESTRTLDAYDAAVLAGGFPRLVDTVVVALVESGAIHVDPSGEFRAQVESSRHPVEDAVLDAVGTRGYRSVESISWRLEHDERLAQEFRHLVTDGLLRHALVPSRLTRTAHPHPTAAGRRALAEFAERARATPGNAVRVAVHGRDAMPDPRLRDEIFSARSTVLPPRSERRPSREVDPGSLGRAAHAAPGLSAAGSWALFGGAHGYVGDDTLGNDTLGGESGGESGGGGIDRRA